MARDSAGLMSLIHDLYHRLIRNPAWFWSTDAGLSALLVSLTLFIFIIHPLSKHTNTGEILRVLFVFVIMFLNIGRRGIEQEREWLAPRAWIGPAALTLVLALATSA
ncbi:MAG: hypothetical protein HGA63_09260 [Syntrophobacteraceae bacterium]|nr:hypothetical protein [Syntrophobacteraceae bacterium]